MVEVHKIVDCSNIATRNKIEKVTAGVNLCFHHKKTLA